MVGMKKRELIAQMFLEIINECSIARERFMIQISKELFYIHSQYPIVLPRQYDLGFVRNEDDVIFMEFTRSLILQ